MIRAAVRVYRRRFARVAVSAALIFGPIAFVEVFALEEIDRSLSGNVSAFLLVGAMAAGAAFLAVALQVLYTGLLDRLVGAELEGKQLSSPLEVARTLPYVRLFIASTLLEFAVAAAAFIAYLPAVLVVGLCAIVAPVILIEDRGVLSAFVRSARLVAPHPWAVFVVIVIPTAVEMAVEILVEQALHHAPLWLLVGTNALVGVGLGAMIGLFEVTLGRELIHRAQTGQSLIDPGAAERAVGVTS